MCLFPVGSPLSSEGFHTDPENVMNLGGFHQREESASLTHWLEKSSPEKCTKRKHNGSPGSDVLHTDCDPSSSGKIYTDLQNVKAFRMSPDSEHLTTISDLGADKFTDDTNAFSNSLFNVGTFGHTGLNTVPTDLDMSQSIGLISGLTLPQTGFICPQVFAQASSDLQQMCKSNLTNTNHISVPSKDIGNTLTSMAHPQVQCVQPNRLLETPLLLDNQSSRQSLPSLTIHEPITLGETNATRRLHKLDIPASLKVVSPEKQKLNKIISGKSLPENAQKDLLHVLNGSEKELKPNSEIQEPGKKLNVASIETKEQTIVLANGGQCEIIVDKNGTVTASKPQISLVSLPTVLISDPNFKSTHLLQVLDPLTTQSNISSKVSLVENPSSKMSLVESKEKDKSKKTLSSKIKEITERIRKDETTKLSIHSACEEYGEVDALEAIDIGSRLLVTATTPPGGSTLETAVIDESSTHSHDGEGAKCKGTRPVLSCTHI